MYQKVLQLLFVLGLLLTPTAVAHSANPSIFEQAMGGASRVIESAYGFDAPTTDPFLPALAAIINFLLTFGGVIFFLLLIYAGYLWMTARGNEEQTSKAKKIATEAIIGILVIVFARLFIELVLAILDAAAQPSPAPGAV